MSNVSLAQTHRPAARVTSARDRIPTVLMALAAIAAFASFAGAIGTVADAGPETEIVETWRMLGFLVFAGIFALLAVRQRALPGLWELSILHKAGMAIIAALAASGDADTAAATALADGLLSVVLVMAYVLARGYAAWRRPPTAPSQN